MTSRRPDFRRRRGAVLLVVLALLALFAVIGLSFVLFAESEATASRQAREAASKPTPLAPADVAGKAISQLVWGTDDVSSVFRGHDLARLMYGEGGPNAGQGDIPYNGVGTVHETLTIPGLGGPAGPTQNQINRAQVVNFTRGLLGTNAAVVDPEYSRADGKVRNQSEGTLAQPLTAAPWVYVAKNAPYTYPDRNNLMVGLSNPSNGQVVMPSGHRPSLYGSLAQTNDNWFDPAGRLKTLRPRRVDHLTAAERTGLGANWPPTGTNAGALRGAMGTTVGAFPYPTANPDGTITGDVQNLKFAGGLQNADSFWMDIGLPAVTDPKGRRLVPLVAPLLMPLDGRVNLNVAGNLVSDKLATPAIQHRSAAGFGPHEINPAWLSALNTGTMPTATSQDATNARTFTHTRYGANAVVEAPASAAQATSRFFQLTADPQTPGTDLDVPPPSYAPVPWDGRLDNVPVFAAGKESSPRYDFQNKYTPVKDSPKNHPTLWNPFERPAFGPSDPNPSAATSTPVERRAYPLSDLRLFAGRFSDGPLDYRTQTFLANDTRGSLTAFQSEYLGTGTAPTPAQGTGPTSPANRVRTLVTPYSTSRATPGLSYNWSAAASSKTDTLTYTAGQATPARTSDDGMTQAPPRLDLAALTANVGDGIGSTQAAARNLRAALHGVDLNRKLADYRQRLNDPLMPASGPIADNVSTSTQPAADRQKLARDIFLRLAVATGAKIGYDSALPDVPAAPTDSYYGKYVLPTPDLSGMYTLPAGGSCTKAEYDALRWLAQLAANLVDLLDTDDVMTAFVWNPADPTNPTDPANFDSAAAMGGQSALSQRVVFGTERPRLVVNEVYAEVANTAADAARTAPLAGATQPFPVRFFVELLNPANRDTTPAAGSTDPVHPLLQPLLINNAETNDFRGAVPLHYGSENQSCYRLVIADDGTKVRTDLQMVDNVRGDILTDTTIIKAIATLQDLSVDAGETANVSTQSVEPNAGQATGNAGTAGGRNGFAVVGPAYTHVTNDIAFTPDPATVAQFKAMLSKANGPQTPNQNPTNAPNQLQYNAPGGALDQMGLSNFLSQVSGPNGRKHAVLLQRLANPYLPFNSNTNPYVTVDYLSRVEVHDGAKNLRGMDNPARQPPPNSLPMGQVPDGTKYMSLNLRFALGRVQPYGGDEGDTQTPPLTNISDTDLQASTSLTNRQTGNGGGAATSFFAHNSPAPTNGNFEWLVHLDRKLVAPSDLFFAGTTKPHELTHKFGRPGNFTSAGGGPVYHRHDLQHPAVTDSASNTVPAGPLFAAGSPLYRALDLLQVKPWTANTPLAGRQSGKVNINMLFDGGGSPSRVFRAVMDKQAGNQFTEGELDTVWQNLLASRSPGWANGLIQPTADELGIDPASGVPDPTTMQTVYYAPASFTQYNQFDRPFKGFGAGLFSLPPTSPAQAGVIYPTAPTPPPMKVSLANRPPGIEDTLLRSLPLDASGNPPPPAPGSNGTTGLFQVPTNTVTHPYQQWEPLRKAFNSFTTTTDTYVLLLTVGYFEVIETDAGQPARILRGEAFDQNPGDLRTQYMAVIDRTALAKPIPQVTDLSGLTADAEGRAPNTDGFYPYNPATEKPDRKYAVPGSAPWVLEPLTVTPVPPPPAAPTSFTITVPAEAAYKDPVTGTDVGATGTYDGTTWVLKAGTRFLVGVGDQQRLLRATAVTFTQSVPPPPAAVTTTPAFATVTAVLETTAPGSLGLARDFAAGEMVSNVRFGNPGPQPGKVLRVNRPDPVVKMFVELK